jgi:PhoPQ-activated pathogenicity-related protein
MSTYVKIETIEVGSGGASTITFSSIPSTYTDLLLKLSLRDNRSGYAINSASIKFNSTSTTYVGRQIYYSSGSLGSGTSTAWGIPSPVDTSYIFTNTDIYIPNYANNKHKAFVVDNAAEGNGSYYEITMITGLWQDTTAISNVSFSAAGSASFVEYSSATLYGIKSS